MSKITIYNSTKIELNGRRNSVYPNFIYFFLIALKKGFLYSSEEIICIQETFLCYFTFYLHLFHFAQNNSHLINLSLYNCINYESNP